IADERIGHADDLALVGGVGEDFLVAGHGGVETNLPARARGRAESLSVKHRAVFQRQNCFHHAAQTCRAMLRSSPHGSSIMAARQAGKGKFWPDGPMEISQPQGGWLKVCEDARPVRDAGKRPKFPLSLAGQISNSAHFPATLWLANFRCRLATDEIQWSF